MTSYLPEYQVTPDLKLLDLSDNLVAFFIINRTVQYNTPVNRFRLRGEWAKI